MLLNKLVMIMRNTTKMMTVMTMASSLKKDAFADIMLKILGDDNYDNSDVVDDKKMS